jgi:uncharacterized protein (PEP-CTERM system associated)
MDHDSWSRRDRTSGLLGPPPAAKIRILVVVGLIGASPAAGQNWRITPSIGVAATLTDNVELAPSDRKRSDLVTQITPGIRVVGTGGRVKLNLNYRMQALLYANSSSNNDIQHFLDGSATVEAVDNWLFIDARANISQQVVSAFGAQPNEENVNANRTQASTYRISPYIRGRLGATSDYELRYSFTTTSAGGAQSGGIDVQDLIGTLKGGTNLAALGWSLNASNQTISSSQGGDDTELRRLRGSLTYLFDPQIRVSALGGWESNTFSGASRGSAATYGGSVEWTLSPRTQVKALMEKRSFGDTHEASFTHRTPLSSWQFSDRRSITTTPEQLALGRTGTAFDVMFDALASRFPDPVIRAQEVERLLLQSGTPRDLPVATTFLTSRVLLQRSRTASVGLLGVRNTVTVAAGMSESRAIDAGSAVVDDFSRASEIQQRSLTASWGRRLTPVSSLNLLGSHVRSSGTAGASLESRQSTARLVFSHQLSQKTTASLAARWVRFDNTTAGTASGYREKAITASVLVTF